MYVDVCLFLPHNRDYVTFISEMQVLITSDELAKDVAGAKALLERHQEHKVSFVHVQTRSILV